MYGNNSWVGLLTNKDVSRIQPVGMKFLRSKIRNYFMSFAINKKVDEYKEKWETSVNRMGQTC